MSFCTFYLTFTAPPCSYILCIVSLPFQCWFFFPDIGLWPMFVQCVLHHSHLSEAFLTDVHVESIAVATGERYDSDELYSLVYLWQENQNVSCNIKFSPLSLYLISTFQCELFSHAGTECLCKPVVFAVQLFGTNTGDVRGSRALLVRISV